MKSFHNDYLSINDNGIDLLRNHFPYKHINYSDVNSIKISNGYLLQNRFIILLVGFLFIGISLKLLSPEIEILKEIPNSPGPLYVRGVPWLLFIPLAFMSLGLYFLIQSLKKSKILLIVTKTGHFNIRVKEFEKTDEIQDLIGFLNTKLFRKVEI